jgi:hypothetical protein
MGHKNSNAFINAADQIGVGVRSSIFIFCRAVLIASTGSGDDFAAIS